LGEVAYRNTEQTLSTREPAGTTLCWCATHCLCRLPKLDSLDIKVEADELPSVPLAMALHSLRTQLQQLRWLNLELKQGLRSAQRVWDELGNMTQLISLSICFYDKTVGDDDQLADFTVCQAGCDVTQCRHMAHMHVCKSCMFGAQGVLCVGWLNCCVFLPVCLRT
jgi:hypothetical protein